MYFFYYMAHFSFAWSFLVLLIKCIYWTFWRHRTFVMAISCFKMQLRLPFSNYTFRSLGHYLIIHNCYTTISWFFFFTISILLYVVRAPKNFADQKSLHHHYQIPQAGAKCRNFCASIAVASKEQRTQNHFLCTNP